MDWICPDELAKEALTSKEQGQPTERFATLAIHIAKMFYSHNNWGNTTESTRAEFLSDFQMRFVLGWEKISEDKNIRSYIKKMARFAALDRLRRNKCRMEYEMRSGACVGDFTAISCLGMDYVMEVES